MIKIGLIQTAKFNISNYSDVVKFEDFKDITHRTTEYKKLIAFEEYIDGYPFDYVFNTQEELDAWMVYVPQTISKLQCVKLLLERNRYTELITAIDSDTTGVSRILFDAAAILDRNSTMVNQFANILGFSSEDTDSFFVEASKILI